MSALTYNLQGKGGKKMKNMEKNGEYKWNENLCIG